MVKFVKLLLLSCVFVLGGCVGDLSEARAEENQTTTYAKALVGCNLYKTQEMSDAFEDVYFQIPETYFMIILDMVSDDCFKVQYDKYIGYVDSSTVIVATFIPILKTLDNITFDIKSTSGTQIWQYPTTKSNICTTISAGTKNITYVAFAYGLVPTGGESNIWYYVHFTPDTNSTSVYEGYVYSENTTNLTEIVANTETNPEVISKENELENKIIYISSTIKTIVIAIVVVPIILFFAIILYKLTQKFKKTTNNNKNSKLLKDDNLVEMQGLKNGDKFEKYKQMKLVKHGQTNVNFGELDDDDLL